MILGNMITDAFAALGFLAFLTIAGLSAVVALAVNATTARASLRKAADMIRKGGES